ncbi:NUDIX domain-containing protein [Modestobacter sp. NPDC049651]|uniref:NUDIX hydrolase n=1 Tax=unclassified Modestobacter TaxID=2643866 RepID=UPI0033C28BBF
MPVPEFIRSLRERIGHDLLWLPGVTGVVFDDVGRVLLGRRADTGEWALPSGIPEPGEQMAEALAREVAEETGVEVVVERLLGLWTHDPLTYPNGDVCQFVDHAFACRATGGRAHVADDESLDVGWFALADLPPLRGSQRELVALALRPDTPPVF